MVSGIVSEVTCGCVAGGMEVAQASCTRAFEITISGLYGIMPVGSKAEQIVDFLNVCRCMESILSKNLTLSNSLHPEQVAASTASVW